MTSRNTDYRRRKRLGLVRQPQPCGTYAAARRHQRHGEPLDPECRRAVSEHNAEMYRLRKETR